MFGQLLDSPLSVVNMLSLSQYLNLPKLLMQGRDQGTSQAPSLVLPKFGSVQFAEHFAWILNLNLPNWFKQVQCRFELKNLVISMVNEKLRNKVFCLLTPVHEAKLHHYSVTDSQGTLVAVCKWKILDFKIAARKVQPPHRYPNPSKPSWTWSRNIK